MNRSEAGIWPWPTLPFADPPWVLHCDLLTTWFHVDVEALRPYMHQDFLPNERQAVARARFYTIIAQTSQGEVPFKEMTLGVRDPAGHIGTEIAFVMWTDSWEYLSWGREHFGWPLAHAHIEIPADFYREPGHIASIPEAGIRAEVRSFGSRVELPTPSAWVTPRRRLLTNGPSEETLLVRPEVSSPGMTQEADVTLDLGHWFDQPKWGRSLITRGAVLRVGGDVQIEPR